MRHILHCVKSARRIRSYSGPYFPAFGLNTDRYGVSLHIQSECGKIRTKITPNTDTLQALLTAHELCNSDECLYSIMIKDPYEIIKLAQF